MLSVRFDNFLKVVKSGCVNAAIIIMLSDCVYAEWIILLL